MRRSGASVRVGAARRVHSWGVAQRTCQPGNACLWALCNSVGHEASLLGIQAHCIFILYLPTPSHTLPPSVILRQGCCCGSGTAGSRRTRGARRTRRGLVSIIILHSPSLCTALLLYNMYICVKVRSLPAIQELRVGCRGATAQELPDIGCEGQLCSRPQVCVCV